MEDIEEFEKRIAPFTWGEFDDDVSVCLSAGKYLSEAFEAQGFEGSGYDWDGLANVFLEEQHPELIEQIHFDSEAGMFCVYSEDVEAMRAFISSFREACEDRDLILDMLSRAEPD